MSGIISDNVGRASGVIAAAAGGGKCLAVKQTVINANDISSTSTTWANIAGFAITTDTLASSSSKLLIQIEDDRGNTSHYLDAIENILSVIEDRVNRVVLNLHSYEEPTDI